MRAYEWIERVKKARQIDSDYAVAKTLGVSRTAVSRYRNHPGTLDEDIAIKVANAIGEKPEAVLLDQLAERVKDAQTRTALLDMARAACALCKIIQPAKARRATLSIGSHRRHVA